jgi:hypothetical protein
MPYSFPSKTSGAAYPGLPHLFDMAWGSDRSAEMPKSASFAIPSDESNMFSGLTSL